MKEKLFAFVAIMIMTACTGNDEPQYVGLPENLQVSLSTSSEGNTLDATLQFSADGAAWYVTACHDLNTNNFHYDTLALVNTHTFNGLASDHNYEFRVEAFNSAGSVEKTVFLLDESVADAWSLLVWNNGTDKIRFSVCYNKIAIDYPVIKSEIYENQSEAQLLLTQNSPDKIVDVSSLPRGIYVLKVTLENGQVLSGMFAKR